MLTVYKVGKGESFSTIAVKFGVSSEGLRHDNGFSGEVFEGARLIIRPSKTVHTVKPFEKLSDIASFYHLTTAELMSANYITKPFVFAGQVLVIPKEDE